MGVQPLYLLSIVVKHPLQIARYPGHVERTVTISQHGLGAVITGNDNKTAPCVKDVVVSRLGQCRRRFTVHQPGGIRIGSSLHATGCLRTGYEARGRLAGYKGIDRCG